MGFGVPLDHWFRGPLADFARDVLCSTAARSAAASSARRRSARLLDDHVAGRFDHSYRLWSLLVLELWQRRGWIGLEPIVRSRLAPAVQSILAAMRSHPRDLGPACSSMVPFSRQTER